MDTVDKSELKRLNEKNKFMSYNGVYITELNKERCTITSEIGENSCNIYGKVHGGLFCTMIDCAAGALARTDGRKYVTSSLNINFIRNVGVGSTAVATAELISRGRKIANILTKIHDKDSNTLLAEGIVTYYCVD